jgi:hypothetical protein
MTCACVAGFCFEAEDSGEVLDIPLVPLTPVRLKIPEGSTYTSPFQQDKVRPLQMDAKEAEAPSEAVSTAPSDENKGPSQPAELIERM